MKRNKNKKNKNKEKNKVDKKVVSKSFKNKLSLSIAIFSLIFSILLISSILIVYTNKPISLVNYSIIFSVFFSKYISFVKYNTLFLIPTAIAIFISALMILSYRRNKPYSYIKLAIFILFSYSLYLITLKASNISFPNFLEKSVLNPQLTSLQISFRLFLSLIFELILFIILRPICDYLNDKRMKRLNNKPKVKKDTKVDRIKDIDEEKNNHDHEMKIKTKTNKSDLGIEFPRPIDVPNLTFLDYTKIDNDINVEQEPINVEKYESKTEKIKREMNQTNKDINSPYTISLETLRIAKKNVEEKMNKINTPQQIKKPKPKPKANSDKSSLDLKSVINERLENSNNDYNYQKKDDKKIQESESLAVRAYREKEAKEAKEKVSSIYNLNSHNNNSTKNIERKDNREKNNEDNSIKNIMQSGFLVKATQENSLKKEINDLVNTSESKKTQTNSIIDEINKNAKEHKHHIIKDDEIDDIPFNDSAKDMSSSLFSNSGNNNFYDELKENEIPSNNYYSSAKPVENAELVDEKEENVKTYEDNEDLESAVAGLSCSSFVNPTSLTYNFPPLSLLDDYPVSQEKIDDATKEKAEILIETLSQFKYDVSLRSIVKGPSVTMFEIVPKKSIKVNSITSLRDNIAMNLKAKKVRILAPIPGQSAVGVEIPNDVREKVGFKEVLNSFENTHLSIPMAMGRNLYGECISFDVTTSPHMLIAGSTGSGKSVCVNSLICSILYSKTPRDIRLIMVDPKVVELTIYNDIPHLLTPVITEPKRALKALDFCIDEMDRRNKMLAKMSVRNIKSYNKKIKEQKIAKEKMPYIVVIIDEFASLMSIAGKELDEKVSRLTAMSRAVGIHLVFATQRPSVDVITGVIKNNLPTRVAFGVTSTQDSRTIIGTSGAEDLLGKGDMLFSANGKAVVRMQGVFLSDEEVEDIVEFAKKQENPEYIDESYFEDLYEEDNSENYSSNNEYDDLWDAALQIAYERNGTSASYLQRRLRIGYNKAASIVEAMEEEGILGPPNGSKPRELIKYQ